MADRAIFERDRKRSSLRGAAVLDGHVTSMLGEEREAYRKELISIFFVARTESTVRFSRLRAIFRLSRPTIARMWKRGNSLLCRRIANTCSHKAYG